MKERFSIESAREEAEALRAHAKAAGGEREPTSDEYHDAALDRAAEEERQERPERLKRLTALVHDLFPGEDDRVRALRAEIVASFNVPQFGKHHQEGLFMDTHLALILEQVEDMRQGRFPEGLPEEIRELLSRVAQQYGDTVLPRYTFLHDIAKKDCLRVKYADDRTRELSWDEWQTEIPEAAKTDPVALRAFCKTQGISSIAYYHKDRAKRQHGAVGAVTLRPIADAVGISKAVVTAIDKHELTFNCMSAKASYYGDNLGGLTQEERDLAIAANYVDTAASMRRGQLPELEHFLHFADAKYNFELIDAIGRALAERQDLAQRKVKHALQSLRGRKERIHEPREELIARIAAESLPDTPVMIEGVPFYGRPEGHVTQEEVAATLPVPDSQVHIIRHFAFLSPEDRARLVGQGITNPFNKRESVIDDAYLDAQLKVQGSKFHPGQKLLNDLTRLHALVLSLATRRIAAAELPWLRKYNHRRAVFSVTFTPAMKEEFGLDPALPIGSARVVKIADADRPFVYQKARGEKEEMDQRKQNFLKKDAEQTTDTLVVELAHFDGREHPQIMTAYSGIIAPPMPNPETQPPEEMASNTAFWDAHAFVDVEG